jgi:general stress protein 26
MKVEIFVCVCVFYTITTVDTHSVFQLKYYVRIDAILNFVNSQDTYQSLWNTSTAIYLTVL